MFQKITQWHKKTRSHNCKGVRSQNRPTSLRKFGLSLKDQFSQFVTPIESTSAFFEMASLLPSNLENAQQNNMATKKSTTHFLICQGLHKIYDPFTIIFHCNNNRSLVSQCGTLLQFSLKGIHPLPQIRTGPKINEN